MISFAPSVFVLRLCLEVRAASVLCSLRWLRVKSVIPLLCALLWKRRPAAFPLNAAGRRIFARRRLLFGSACRGCAGAPRGFSTFITGGRRRAAPCNSRQGFDCARALRRDKPSRPGSSFVRADLFSASRKSCVPFVFRSAYIKRTVWRQYMIIKVILSFRWELSDVTLRM